jgi:Spy/CpxP family protein refolding chaperone
MKALLLTALTLVGLPLLAQTSSTTSTSSTTTTSTTAPTAPTAPPQSQQQMMEQVMSTLTPAERDELMAARQKAITDNPNLQTEGSNLALKGMALQSGTATDADKQAFRTAIMAYGEEVRSAMIKADPAVAPLLAKVEAEGAKLRAEYGH